MFPKIASISSEIDRTVHIDDRNKRAVRVAGTVHNLTEDQSLPPFHRYFMTEDKTDITLTSNLNKNTTIIPVSEGHGFTTSHYMLINYESYIQQTKVKSVDGNNITLDSPIGIPLPIIGTQIIRGSIEMNVDGSVTPVTFYCRAGVNAKDVDLQHFVVFIRDTADGDQATYGGLPALTNGTFIRYENNIDLNLGTYKNNENFIEFGAVGIYNDKAPAGEYSQSFNFDIIGTYGVIFKLHTPTDCIAITIRDNLTGLTYHRAVAMGHTHTNNY